jgi:hypothetical protein
VSKNRRDVPASIDTLLEKGLSARPRSRHGSAAEFGTALDEALGARPKPIVVPDPPFPPPVPPPEPDKEKKPWFQYQGMLAGLSKRTKLILGGVGVVFVLGAIGNMMETGGGGDPPDFPPADTLIPEPPPERPDAFAAGYWIDSYNNRFNVTHDGTQFTAVGNVAGFGEIRLSGTLTRAGAQFTLRTQAGAVLQGRGEIYEDGAGLPHMRYSLADGSTGDFKINHVN